MAIIVLNQQSIISSFQSPIDNLIHSDRHFRSSIAKLNHSDRFLATQTTFDWYGLPYARSEIFKSKVRIKHHHHVLTGLRIAPSVDLLGLNNQRSTTSIPAVFLYGSPSHPGEKVCRGNRDFHQNSCSYTKWRIAATCPFLVLKRLQFWKQHTRRNL